MDFWFTRTENGTLHKRALRCLRPFSECLIEAVRRPVFVVNITKEDDWTCLYVIRVYHTTIIRTRTTMHTFAKCCTLNICGLRRSGCCNSCWNYFHRLPDHYNLYHCWSYCCTTVTWEIPWPKITAHEAFTRKPYRTPSDFLLPCT